MSPGSAVKAALKVAGSTTRFRPADLLGALAESAIERSDPLDESANPPDKPDRWGKAVFEVIEWRRFEAVIERLFQQAGFETQSQTHGADEGVDVWLYSRNQPGVPVSLVQCKHWQGKKVGVDKVRELRGVMAWPTFTPDAVTFARLNASTCLMRMGCWT